jgi:hypothetical protein
MAHLLIYGKYSLPESCVVLRQIQVKNNVKVPLYLIKHYAVSTLGGVDV